MTTPSAENRSYWVAKPGDGVSAVIAHWGDPALAQRLVGDLRSQNYPGPIEIIVSDDASPTEFPPTDGVTVVRSPTNGGFGAAINRGAAVATQPWLFSLNSDVRMDPDLIANLTQAAKQWQPAVCAVRERGRDRYFPIHRTFPTIRTTAASHIRLLASAHRRNPERWPIENTDPADDKTGSVDWLVGCALLLPRSLFEAVGGFDERYYMYSEEVDLQKKLRLLNVPSVLIAELEVDHDAGQSSGLLDIPVQMLRSRLIYQGKWSGQSSRHLLIAVLATGVVLDSLTDQIRRLAGRPSPEWRTGLARLRKLREATRPRRQRS